MSLASLSFESLLHYPEEDSAEKELRRRLNDETLRADTLAKLIQRGGKLPARRKLFYESENAFLKRWHTHDRLLRLSLYLLLDAGELDAAARLLCARPDYEHHSGSNLTQKLARHQNYRGVVDALSLIASRAEFLSQRFAALCFLESPPLVEAAKQSELLHYRAIRYWKIRAQSTLLDYVCAHFELQFHIVYQLVPRSAELLGSASSLAEQALVVCGARTAIFQRKENKEGIRWLERLSAQEAAGRSAGIARWVLAQQGEDPSAKEYLLECARDPEDTESRKALQFFL